MLANLENSAVAIGLEKGQFSFQYQRKAMPKNVQTTTQLHSSHVPAKKESEVAQSCPTLCNPMDSSLHQAPPAKEFSRQEVLEWVAIAFSENTQKNYTKKMFMTQIITMV